MTKIGKTSMEFEGILEVGSFLDLPGRRVSLCLLHSMQILALVVASKALNQQLRNDRTLEHYVESRQSARYRSVKSLEEEKGCRTKWELHIFIQIFIKNGYSYQDFVNIIRDSCYWVAN